MSGKNNRRAKRRLALRINYYDRRQKWRAREPDWWRIFAWIRWKSEEPKKPKWLREEEPGWWRTNHGY